MSYNTYGLLTKNVNLATILNDPRLDVFEQITTFLTITSKTFSEFCSDFSPYKTVLKMLKNEAMLNLDVNNLLQLRKLFGTNSCKILLSFPSFSVETRHYGDINTQHTANCALVTLFMSEHLFDPKHPIIITQHIMSSEEYAPKKIMLKELANDFPKLRKQVREWTAAA